MEQGEQRETRGNKNETTTEGETEGAKTDTKTDLDDSNESAEELFKKPTDTSTKLQTTKDMSENELIEDVSDEL